MISRRQRCQRRRKKKPKLIKRIDLKCLREWWKISSPPKPFKLAHSRENASKSWPTAFFIQLLWHRRWNAVEWTQHGFVCVHFSWFYSRTAREWVKTAAVEPSICTHKISNRSITFRSLLKRHSMTTKCSIFLCFHHFTRVKWKGGKKCCISNSIRYYPLNQISAFTQKFNNPLSIDETRIDEMQSKNSSFPLVSFHRTILNVFFLCYFINWLPLFLCRNKKVKKKNTLKINVTNGQTLVNIIVSFFFAFYVENNKFSCSFSPFQTNFVQCSDELQTVAI